MSPSYAQNKKHIYKWCKNNIEKSRAIKLKCELKRICYKREAKIFLNILLD